MGDLLRFEETINILPARLWWQGGQCCRDFQFDDAVQRIAQHHKHHNPHLIENRLVDRIASLQGRQTVEGLYSSRFADLGWDDIFGILDKGVPIYFSNGGIRYTKDIFELHLSKMTLIIGPSSEWDPISGTFSRRSFRFEGKNVYSLSTKERDQYDVWSNEQGSEQPSWEDLCLDEIIRSQGRENDRFSRLANLSRMESQSASGSRQRIPDDIKIFVWRRDEGKCVYCGSNLDLEYDHIIPVIMGGSNTARNLQLLCETCNRSKGGNLV